MTEPRKFEVQAAQGDMLLTKIDWLPAGLEKQVPEKNKVHILTHSETGHHHVVDSRNVNFFKAANDPLMGFIEVKKTTMLRHLREHDTHTEIALSPGVYQINRQREYELGSFRQVAD
jgi:hypothetical protein